MHQDLGYLEGPVYPPAQTAPPRAEHMNLHIAGWTDSFLRAFREAQVKRPTQNLIIVNRYSCILTLDSSPCYSIHVDAAFKDSTSSYSTAFVIYDPGGKLWATGF